MPVILKKSVDSIQIGLWKILEDESYFLNRMQLSAVERDQLSTIKGQRRVHWLASRYLLHLITRVDDRRWNCLKDEFGKPYLEDTDYHISFSHSNELVAVAIGPDKNGIDIQLVVEKIESISHKFIDVDENIPEPRLEGLHVIWGAKEAAYKAYGKKKLDFKTHMKFESASKNQSIQITLEKEEVQENYFGRYEKWGKYVLVYLSEKK